MLALLMPPDFPKALIETRVGDADERAESERLSEVLGGLPLALEQAAAYCEELEIGFAEYMSRFEAAPATVLGTEDYSDAGYRDGQTTVARTFRLAIAAANDIHPVAETNGYSEDFLQCC